jgi:uncharacterized membrane protein YidH (DUF202 family)
MTEENNTPLHINEVQLILAEKRTALAVLRTGVGILALPLSILGLFIVLSKNIDIESHKHLVLLMTTICSFLILTGFYLIGNSLIKMRDYDHMIRKLKSEDKNIEELIE